MDEIIERTDGAPLFLEELTKAVLFSIWPRCGRSWRIRLGNLGALGGHNLGKTRSEEFRNMCPILGSR
jgi:hypothetical protein